VTADAGAVPEAAVGRSGQANLLRWVVRAAAGIPGRQPLTWNCSDSPADYRFRVPLRPVSGGFLCVLHVLLHVTKLLPAALPSVF